MPHMSILGFDGDGLDAVEGRVEGPGDFVLHPYAFISNMSALG